MFLGALASELANVGKSAVARMAAGLQLKNYLTAKDPQLRLSRQQQWLSMDTTMRVQIKTLVRVALCGGQHVTLSAILTGPTSIRYRDRQASITTGKEPTHRPP